LDNLFEKLNVSSGFEVSMNVEIPPRKGLGLSGAESVGAVLCANRLFDLKLGGRKLVEFAAEAEPSRHMDNVSASALGGFNIACFDPVSEQVNFTSIRPPKDLGVAVVVPRIEKKSTEEARHFVPVQIPKQDYVASLGWVSTLSASFALHDVKSIIETLPWDSVVEVARADGQVYGDGMTAKFLYEEKRSLLKTYHVAETISGAGPSRALWFSICEDAKVKRKNHAGIINPAVQVVTERLESIGHKVERVFITKPSAAGAVIKSEE
jgi:homoserine kinase